MEGTPSFILAGKVKALKKDLKTWNADVFGNIDSQKRSLLEYLHIVEGWEVTIIFKESFRKSFITLGARKGALIEEISWRQKSQTLWREH